MTKQGELNSLVRDLRAAQRKRWLRGERVFVESLADEHPELLSETKRQDLLDLVYSEFCLREDLEQQPQAEEYQRRFPQFADELKALFEVHQAMLSGLGTFTAVDERGGLPFPRRLNLPGCDEPLSVVSERVQQQIVCNFSFDSNPTDLSRRSSEKRNDVRPLGHVFYTQSNDDQDSRLLDSTESDFELLSEIGRGGLGVVYVARQKATGMLVAIKCILAGPMTREWGAGRSSNYLRATCPLSHPNVVEIQQASTWQGQPCLVMELLEGGNLAERLAGGAYSVRDAVRLLIAIGDAVTNAHECGVIHGNLKPTDILFASDGTPKVSDFGLALAAPVYYLGHIIRLPFRATIRSLAIWQSQHVAPPVNVAAIDLGNGFLVGDPRYMAPESVAGQINQIDERTDVYSLGAIMHELITGQPPFCAPTPKDVAHMVLDGQYTSKDLKGKLPRRLIDVCQTCLERSPAQRYPYCSAMVAELRHYLND